MITKLKNDESLIQAARVALAAAEASAAVVDLDWIQPPPATDDWALSPDTLRLLMALVKAVRPRHVIELGSGLSTRALARAAAGQRPACVISSVDHDPEYGTGAQAAFRADAARGARVRFQIAPVVVRDCGGEVLPVYGLRTDRLASRRPADIVLIDGPPDVLGGREGTLYQMLDLAQPGTIILLDDAGRALEQQALQRWQENLGLAIEVHMLAGFAKGLAAIVVRQPVPRSALWDHRAAVTTAELNGLLPDGMPVILADQNQWGADLLPGRPVFPFIEQDGGYWGPPENDRMAIENLDRLRSGGARFLVVMWPAFWWLDQYAGFAAYLRARFARTAENSRVKVYDLR